jgi:hypothetical protein
VAGAHLVDGLQDLGAYRIDVAARGVLRQEVTSAEMS